MIGTLNLTGQDVTQTYQNLVTTDGVVLSDATGSRLTGILAITASRTVSSSYSITSSYDISGSWASQSLSTSFALRSFQTNLWHVDPDIHSYYQMDYSPLLGVEFTYVYNDGGNAQALLQMSTSSFYIGQPGAPFQVNSPTTFSVGIQDSNINDAVVYARPDGTFAAATTLSLFSGTSSFALAGQDPWIVNKVESPAGTPSPITVDLTNTALINGAGDGTVNWGTRKLTRIGGQDTVLWNAMHLLDENNNLVVDWSDTGGHKLFGTASVAISSSYALSAYSAQLAFSASAIWPSAGAVSDLQNATGSSAGTAGFTNATELATFIQAVSSSFQTLNGLIAKLRTLGIVS